MKTIFLVIALGVMLAGPRQDRIPELQRDVPKDSDSETLTGCVARGVAAGAYLLTNVTVTKNGNHAQSTLRATPERTSVVLSGPEVDVSKHVGHRVTVSGRYESAGLVAPTGGPGDKPSASGSIAQNETRVTRTFRITSLTMVSDSCSEQADSRGNARAATGSPREA